MHMKAAGMTEEQITAIVSLDEDQYRSERRYHMHTQEFCESDFDDDDGGDNGKSPLYKKYMEQLKKCVRRGGVKCVRN